MHLLQLGTSVREPSFSGPASMWSRGTSQKSDCLVWLPLIRTSSPALAPTRVPALGVIRQIGAVITHYVSPERLCHIRDCRVPVLCVAGLKDNLVSPRNSAYMVSKTSGSLLEFEDAGHGCHEQYEALTLALSLTVTLDPVTSPGFNTTLTLRGR